MVTKGLRHIGIVVSDIEKVKYVFRELFDIKNFIDYHDIDTDYINEVVGSQANTVNIGHGWRTEAKSNFTIRLPEENAELLPHAVSQGHFALTLDSIQNVYERHKDFDVEFINSPRLNIEQTVKLAYIKVVNEIVVELVEELQARWKTSA